MMQQVNIKIFEPIILSCAREVGSPTNPPWAPSSDKTRGQGSFGLFITTYKNLKKKTNRTFDPPFY